MPASLGCSGSEVSALVWTTTPWTLIANKAICYHPDHAYSLVEARLNGTSRVVLVGSKRLEDLSPILGEYRVIRSLTGSELCEILYRNPLELGSGEVRPFLPGFHVSDEEGSGLVHTAPSHGHDDYAVGQKHKLELGCVVDGKGRYTGEATGELEGLSVLEEGGKAVLEKLRSLGVVVQEAPYSHRYPYDWRTKKPVIIRATNQWFASVSSLKEQAKNAVNDGVVFHPSVSKNRLLNFLDKRDDWCISRQRVWGVPLPIFYQIDNDQPLLTDETILHVRKLFGRLGSDCWWNLSKEELLPKSIRPEAQLYRKGEDTMDVWFDSGSSWASVLKGCGSEGGGEVGGVADLYLEGSDQHRGWFQSSLLTSVAVRGRAPYRAVLTHGFVLDKAGDKMSKSVGNVISPADILTTMDFGADVMRMWVASSDYHRDVQLSDDILKQNGNFLQRVRGICRFLLGNLSTSDPSRDLVPYSRLSKLDKYVLHLLSEYNDKAILSYDAFDFSNVHHALSTFLPNDLSSFYFAIIKDRLYCDEEGSEGRRSTLTVLYHLLRAVVHSVAPIAPHLAEEVAQHPPFQGSVFQSVWEECPGEWRAPELANQVELLRCVISVANRALEKARVAKHIRSSLEAEVTICTESERVVSVLQELTRPQSGGDKGVEFPLADLFIVSEASIRNMAQNAALTIKESIFAEEDTVKWCEDEKEEEINVKVVAAPISGRGKCPRCWKWVCPVVEEERGAEQLCERCEVAEHSSTTTREPDSAKTST